MAIVKNANNLKVCSVGTKTAPLSPKKRYNDNEFENKLFEFIKEREGNKSQIYLDTKNLPTIGIGCKFKSKQLAR